MRKTISYYVISLVLVSVLTLGGCIQKPEKVEVPNLIGIELESAIESLDLVGLNPDALKGEAASEKELENIVYFQAPDAGERVRKGSIVTFTFYDQIQVEVRRIAILGTCLDTCQWMWKEMGGEHYKELRFYGNRYGWPGYDLVEELGMKVFVNIRAENWRFSLEEQGELSKLRDYVKSTMTEAKVTGRTRLLGTPQYQNSFRRYKDLLLKSVPNEDEIQRCVNEWKNRPGCGGYWTDTLGHEPDICGPEIERRKKFYDTVRKYDADTQAHPVMEMMNMTEADEENPNWPYPGWKGAFREDTNDLVLVDCYPGMSSPEETIYWINWAWEKFIKKYCHRNQVIIQMQAFEYNEGGIWNQYNAWKELLASEEFDNPYRSSEMGLCWYKDETIRQCPEMQEEIKEVIAHALK